MLMRNAQVLPNGDYIPATASHAKSNYAAMVTVRSTIIGWCSMQLAQAATIATRFSVVRLQGRDSNNPSAGEVPIIHYKHQHYRLFVLIAKAYAMHFMSATARAVLANHHTRLGKGDMTFAQEVHVLFCGLKAWATEHAMKGAEDARRCCGGAGYLNSSGLPRIHGSLSAGPTFEGENHVLYLQVARYLVKSVRALKRGDGLSGSAAYLMDDHKSFSERAASFVESVDLRGKSNDLTGHSTSREAAKPPCPTFGKSFLETKEQIQLFLHRARRLAFTSCALLDAARSTGSSEEDAFNENMMILLDAARAHTELKIIILFHQHIDELQPEYKGVEPVLRRLASLLALTTAKAEPTFLEDGYLVDVQIQQMSNCINILLRELSPDSIALTDAFAFTDASLCSAIGCSDGNAYNRMLAWFRQMPINLTVGKSGGVHAKSYEESVQPILKAKL